MKFTGRKSFLAGIPSWALALIAMFTIFMVLMVIGESIKTETIAAEVIVYIIWGIVNAVCCFFIVRQNSKSVWYVPLIINVIFIIPAFVESMKTSDWIAICGILTLSLIASILGARIGRRKTISDNP
jgi:peptidoglycan/LPS O-acetylase OafA/YrhL